MRGGPLSGRGSAESGRGGERRDVGGRGGGGGGGGDHQGAWVVMALLQVEILQNDLSIRSSE